jgi:hypothetical protein
MSPAHGLNKLGSFAATDRVSIWLKARMDKIGAATQPIIGAGGRSVKRFRDLCAGEVRSNVGQLSNVPSFRTAETQRDEGRNQKDLAPLDLT